MSYHIGYYLPSATTFESVGDDEQDSLPEVNLSSYYLRYDDKGILLPDMIRSITGESTGVIKGRLGRHRFIVSVMDAADTEIIKPIYVVAADPLTGRLLYLSATRTIADRVQFNTVEAIPKARRCCVKHFDCIGNVVLEMRVLLGDVIEGPTRMRMGEKIVYEVKYRDLGENWLTERT